MLNKQIADEESKETSSAIFDMCFIILLKGLKICDIIFRVALIL